MAILITDLQVNSIVNTDTILVTSNGTLSGISLTDFTNLLGHISVVPAGTNSQLQFNSNGSFGAANIDYSVGAGRPSDPATDQFITSETGGLLLGSGNDVYGNVTILLGNRYGLNGVLYNNESQGLVDLAFQANGASQRNIRYETRANINQTFVSNLNTEFEYQFGTPEAWSYAFGDNVAIMNVSSVVIGNSTVINNSGYFSNGMLSSYTYALQPFGQTLSIPAGVNTEIINSSSLPFTPTAGSLYRFTIVIEYAFLNTSFPSPLVSLDINYGNNTYGTWEFLPYYTFPSTFQGIIHFETPPTYFTIQPLNPNTSNSYYSGSLSMEASNNVSGLSVSASVGNIFVYPSNASPVGTVLLPNSNTSITDANNNVWTFGSLVNGTSNTFTVIESSNNNILFGIYQSSTNSFVNAVASEMIIDNTGTIWLYNNGEVTANGWYIFWVDDFLSPSYYNSLNPSNPVPLSPNTTPISANSTIRIGPVFIEKLI